MLTVGCELYVNYIFFSYMSQKLVYSFLHILDG